LFEIKNNVEDIEYLIEKILETERTLGRSDVVINMESTGVYHLPLYSALSEIMEKVSNGQKRQVNPEDLISLAEDSIRCDVADRGALFGLKLIMEDIEYLDRRIEYIDGEIKVYWDNVKNHLYFPTFPGYDQSCGSTY
jgi:hypothetical protein